MNTERLPVGLEQVRVDLEAWRGQRRKGDRIPEEVWRRAVCADRRHGLNAVSRVLRLDYYHLKRRAVRGPTARPASSLFVEGSCKTPRGMGVSPMNHGQDARTALNEEGVCRSLVYMSKVVVCGVVALALLGGVCADGAESASADWPCWRGPKGDGLPAAVEMGPGGAALLQLEAAGPRELWKSRELSAGHNDPVIVGEYAYAFKRSKDAKGLARRLRPEIKRSVGEFMRYLRCLAAGLAFIICLAVDEAFGVTNVNTGGEATWSATEREVLFQKLLAGYCAVLKSAPPDAPVAVKLGGWPALQIPSCSIMGLVLLGEGNTRTRGPYAAQLDKLYKYVAVTASKDEPAIKSHESWMLAFALLFLSEMHRADPSEGLRHRIEALVKRLETGRQGDKGWCHTLKHTDYGPFVGVTIWCAAALAAAAEQGVAVDKEGLAAALRTLRNSVSSAGGAGYFDHPDNTASVGRAAGVAWVLTRYGAGNETEIARCRAFLARHADVAPLGHGSWMMHMTLSAMCAACADETTRETFWKAQRPGLFRARAPDGFFRIQAWEETGFNGDVCVNLGREKTWPDPMYGDAWATVWMFLAWQAERGKCLLARKSPPPAVAARASRPSLPALDEAAILAKIKTGRGLEAQQTLGELVRKFPDDARLYRLHALANIPALLEPFPADEKAFATGWGATVEANALRDLAASLSKQAGKGDISEEFDAGVHLLRAKIFAKQTLTTFNPKSVAWVQANNQFVAEIRALQKMGAMGVEAVALTRRVNAKLAVLAK